MKYLLTFKPLKNFFFGNDRTFSDDYLAISEYFPQNTQLLGALRLFIAEQNKLMHVHKNGKYSNEPEKLKRLIGTASSKDFSTNSDLGKIQNISQMFLVSSSLDDAYFPTPFDIEITEDRVQYYELAHIENDYFLQNYDVKKASSQKLGNAKFWKNYTHKQELSKEHFEDMSEIFITHSQVGIGLENKKTIEGAFYSKTDYQLKNGFLFACLIELDEKTSSVASQKKSFFDFLFGRLIKLNEEIISDGIIQIGAENSLFELKIIPYENTQLTSHPIVSQLFTQPQKGDKAVAISDVILQSTEEFHAYFTIVPFYKNFAMLKSENESFQGKSKEKSFAKFEGKTDQKRLIPTGTVSYIKEQVMPHNQTLGAYAKMGYNQFITAKI
ncbi:MAG: type III-B CRISPR module-associated Cmr3 family protein [Sulfurimonas sp.]|jgi:CRISPR type III-B/RAMP module-associated protein Cmr3